MNKSSPENIKADVAGNERKEDNLHLSPSSEVSGLIRIATYASVSIAIILILAKLGAWMATESVSLLSSLADSLLDAGASLVNLIAVRQALQPADRDHRFGHGKAEALAGLAQGAFIFGSGVFLILESVDRLVNPKPVINTEIGIQVMVFALVLTFLLVFFQFYVIKKTNSLVVIADSYHYRVDILVNVAVILSLFISSYNTFVYADALFAIAIVIYMGFGSWKILLKSLDVLMDRELPEEDRNKIKQIVLRHPKVFDVHDLRSRTSGVYSFVQLHLEMDRTLSLIEAHEIADEVMYQVEEVFPDMEVLIHQDPEGVDERRDEIEN